MVGPCVPILNCSEVIFWQRSSLIEIGRRYSACARLKKIRALIVTRHTTPRYDNAVRAQLSSFNFIENQTPCSSSWPVVFVTLPLSTLLLITFLTLLLSMVEMNVAHQFAYVFTKNFENFIGFIIWWNFFLNIFHKIGFKSSTFYLLEWWQCLTILKSRDCTEKNETGILGSSQFIIDFLWIWYELYQIY